MIKKLQIKFVLLSMGAFLLVLSVIITAINIVNFNAVVSEADGLLSILSENKGAFPLDPGGFGDRLPIGMSPETPYESRYFSVILDSNSNTVIQVETSRIISVDTTQAIAYAKSAISAEKESGFLDQYRYRIHTETLFTRITFLDCGRKLDAYHSFLIASIAISLIGYLVVFALIAFFSNRIIRPILESHEKQKRFITDAGHEIKTPLTIIHADADVLAMELGENEWLEDIQKQAERLTALTNDLVLLSRMEEAESSMQMIDFPVSDVVSETAASFHAPAQTQRKQLHCIVQPLLTLRGNEKAISQLVSILLDNALKYSPADSEIFLTMEKQGRTLHLSVSNTAVQPLTRDSLSQLFDRFYRTDPSRNSQTGGHGIGLSVARSIVSAHNGKICAVSEDGHTLEISVTLPIA